MLLSLLGCLCWCLLVCLVFDVRLRFGFYVDTGSLLGVLVWRVFGLVLFVFLNLGCAL